MNLKENFLRATKNSCSELVIGYCGDFIKKHEISNICKELDIPCTCFQIPENNFWNNGEVIGLFATKSLCKEVKPLKFNCKTEGLLEFMEKTNVLRKIALENNKFQGITAWNNC